MPYKTNKGDPGCCVPSDEISCCIPFPGNETHDPINCDRDSEICEFSSADVARFSYCLIVMATFWITECIPIGKVRTLLSSIRSLYE